MCVTCEASHTWMAYVRNNFHRTPISAHILSLHCDFKNPLLKYSRDWSIEVYIPKCLTPDNPRHVGILTTRNTQTAVILTERRTRKYHFSSRIPVLAGSQTAEFELVSILNLSFQRKSVLFWAVLSARVTGMPTEITQGSHKRFGVCWKNFAQSTKLRAFTSCSLPVRGDCRTPWTVTETGC